MAHNWKDQPWMTPAQNQAAREILWLESKSWEPGRIADRIVSRVWKRMGSASGRNERNHRMKPTLNTNEWMQVVAALKSKMKSPVTAGGDRESREWRAHLREIRQAIIDDEQALQNPAGRCAATQARRPFFALPAWHPMVTGRASTCRPAGRDNEFLGANPF